MSMFSIKLKNTVQPTWVHKSGFIIVQTGDKTFETNADNIEDIRLIGNRLPTGSILSISYVLDQEDIFVLLSSFKIKIRLNFALTPDNPDTLADPLKIKFYNIIQRYFCFNPQTNSYFFDLDALNNSSDSDLVFNLLNKISQIYSD